jgi:ABC-type glycerol-3-phosphate transport system substrate-binding protein
MIYTKYYRRVLIMKKGRKLIALLLVFITVFSLVGCGKAKSDEKTTSTDNSASTNVKSEAKDEGDKTEADTSDNAGSSEFQTTYGAKKFDNVKITVEVFDRSNAPEGSTVIDNKWVDYINENMNKVGINVEFVAVPRSEEVAKIQLMMSAGTGPDLMLCYTSSVVEGFYNDGGTYDLAPYIDGPDQAQNLKEYVGEECLNIARNKDNALWAVPARRSVTSAFNIFLRKDWLDALGLQIPTTVDEMYNVIKAFKENNPDGRKDVIASSFFTCKKSSDVAGPLSYAFLKSVADETTFNISAGNPTDLIYTDEGFGEYFKWMNKLYNEGLMDPEYYLGNDQTLKEDFVNGKLGCFESNVNYNVDSLRGSLLKTLQSTDPDADIISIPPLKNIHDGKVYNDGYPINGAFVFVPKTCKNVEAAITYLDWLATQEGGFALFHGMEGEHFTFDAEGTPCVKDAAYNATDKDWIRHDLFLIGNQGYYKTPEEFAKATSKEAPGYEEYVLKNYENASFGIVRHDPTFTSPTYTEKTTEISLLRDEYFVKLITCAPADFDTTLEEFKSKLKNAGYDQIIQERTDFYKAQ